jgi:hypothetical protein
MRWEDLFADLEAQLEREQSAEHRAEVTDRTRRELAAITLLDRLTAARGSEVGLGLAIAIDAVPAAEVIRGVVVDVAAQWVLVEEVAHRATLVPMAAVGWVSGLGRASAPRPEHSMARRLGLGAALRTLARDRVPVTVRLRDGGTLSGTFDRVGADHVDLAEHQPDEPRRAGAVRGVRTVPFAAIGFVRPA